ncbi:phage major capsid protein, P2 family, partial [Shewanella sp. D64]
MLTKRTELQLSALTTALQTVYGITDPTKQFSLTEPMEIKLRKKILESDAFLRLITHRDVDQIQGQVVDVGLGKLFTGRAIERFRKKVGMDGKQYSLVETDSCACIPWAVLAAWGNSGSDKEFIRLVTENANKNFALDMLKIGFNGTSVVPVTNPDENPLGEDVNIGWHQYVKNTAPTQIITAPVYLDVEGNGTYKNLDSLVQDVINTHIHPVFQNDPRLVVLVGTDLVSYEQHRLLDAATTPTEHKAAQSLSKTIAGRKAYTPPFFPSKRVVVTLLENLHLYTQKGSRRRKSENSEDRKQHESSLWRYEGYAVPESEAYAAIDEAAMIIGPRPPALKSADVERGVIDVDNMTPQASQAEPKAANAKAKPDVVSAEVTPLSTIDVALIAAQNS